MKASSSYPALLLRRLLLAAPPYSNPILSPIETIPSALVIGSHTPDSNLRRSGIGNYIYYRERANPLNTLRKPLSQPIIPLPPPSTFKSPPTSQSINHPPLHTPSSSPHPSPRFSIFPSHPTSPRHRPPPSLNLHRPPSHLTSSFNPLIPQSQSHNLIPRFSLPSLPFSPHLITLPRYQTSPSHNTHPSSPIPLLFTPFPPHLAIGHFHFRVCLYE